MAVRKSFLWEVFDAPVSLSVSPLGDLTGDIAQSSTRYSRSGGLISRKKLSIKIAAELRRARLLGCKVTRGSVIYGDGLDLLRTEPIAKSRTLRRMFLDRGGCQGLHRACPTGRVCRHFVCCAGERTRRRSRCGRDDPSSGRASGVRDIFAGGTISSGNGRCVSRVRLALAQRPQRSVELGFGLRRWRLCPVLCPQWLCGN